MPALVPYFFAFENSIVETKEEVINQRFKQKILDLRCKICMVACNNHKAEMKGVVDYHGDK